ncbi:AEC family transporter [Haloquadratum walsbyi]|uniref:Auxin permease family transport protein n=1 Tax=Haloquadratum walsbyi (strain DSM 16854 / JCM 12705 / C23) TaxID=768065 RepID=G0LHL3_HALWC|nr:AEC family transporter [Haloquadratum walsbyi]CCC39251.1 auxin permease family transport protein [Haloquadratum walsbyi C23]
MVSFISVFATAILPIVGVGGVGYLLGRWRSVDTDALNTVIVYILAPALVFYSLATTTLAQSTLFRASVAVIIYHLLAMGVAAGIGRLFNKSKTAIAALMLVTAFPNSGNYGIPVSNFAFGSTGRATAVIYLSVQGIILYTLGVYIASRGGTKSRLAGIKRVFTVPLVYAVIAALIARVFQIVPSTDTTAMATIKLVGDAAIPLMLLVVGIRLARTDIGSTLSAVGLGVGLKMVIAPVIGLSTAVMIGFDDPIVARTFVLESAMPSAVTPMILVAEFGSGDVAGVPIAEFVSAAVFVSTMISIPVLTLVIVILKSGAVI